MKKTLLLSCTLFLIFILTGLFLSSKKILWIDEIFTQLHVEETSVMSLIKGEITDEGNPAPLFYINQKLFLSALGFKSPLPLKNEKSVYEPKSQIILRVPSIIYMSLALSLIFFIFARLYSIKFGVLALLLSLSNPMVWMHWAEARPYSLWLLLSVVQASLFLKIVVSNHQKDWLWLVICHVLLGLTIVFSLPQVIIISLLTMVFKKIDWRKIFPLLGFPIVICYFYYTQTKRTYTWMPSEIGHQIFNAALNSCTNIKIVISQMFSFLIALNIPLDWLNLLLISLSATLFFFVSPSFKKLKIANLIKEQALFQISLILLLLSSFIIISVFQTWNYLGLTKYPPYERYFIFLVPYALFTIMLFLINCLKLSADKLTHTIIYTIFIGTIINASLITCLYLDSLGYFVWSL